MNTIGENISNFFYNNSDKQESSLKQGDLPFLFKVLSINQALSIQAHPNKSLARILHQKDPKNYPDSNHKPEMLIAISEQFDAMCGFRPADEISKNFELYPELVDLCEKLNCDEFLTNKSENSLKKCFSSLMNQSDEFIASQFERLNNRLDNSRSSRTEIDELFLDLAKQYPNDVGCFSIYLLNCLKLKKGEAIYLSANVPHAYLYGDGVECMACSDNVVRAGLTPKFKDVQVLCDMLDYTMRSSEENKLGAVVNKSDLVYLSEFRPSVDEFSVQQIKIELSHVGKSEHEIEKFLIPKSESGSILIIVEASFGNVYLETDKQSGAQLEARPGLVYFIDASTNVYFSVDKECFDKENDIVLLAFRAYCDIKSA